MLPSIPVTDILQFSDPLDLDDNLPVRMREIIITAIKKGKIKPNRIHESYTRIKKLKLGLEPFSSEKKQ